MNDPKTGSTVNFISQLKVEKFLDRSVLARIRPQVLKANVSLLA